MNKRKNINSGEKENHLWVVAFFLNAPHRPEPTMMLNWICLILTSRMSDVGCRILPSQMADFNKSDVGYRILTSWMLDFYKSDFNKSDVGF